MDVHSATSWLFLLFINFGKLKVFNGKLCGKDMYRVSKNGTISCFACGSCVYGEGLRPPCGSLIKHPPQVACYPCESGISYSDEHGPSICKKCSHCSRHEIISNNCTVESDVMCSHTCEPGFYYDNSSHNCQKCSLCCGDASDIRIAACKTSLKQCSFHNADRCTPTMKTTMSTSTASTSTNKTTQAKSTGLIVGIIVGSVFIAFIFVFVLRRCYTKYQNKRIHERANNGEDRMENGDLHLVCGFKQTSFQLRLSNCNEPVRKTELLQHGSELLIRIVCENENNNNCFEQCNFEWIKDGKKLPNQEEDELKMKNVRIIDSGNYHCRLYCQRHKEDKESNQITIHIKPRQGEELKLLKDISLDKRQKVQTILKPKVLDIGNWQNVGDHYGMDPDTLTSIKDDDDRAEKVIDFLYTSQPELTVFEFCEFLKTTKQHSAVNELSGDLTCSTEDISTTANTSLNDTRDSGVYTEEQCVPLRVVLPESKESESLLNNRHRLNTAYCDSSREGSLDELPTEMTTFVKKATNSLNDNGGKVKRKRSFSRQGSNQSNKSAGNVSINSIKAAASNAVKKLPMRKNSYFEHKVDEDTDDSEVY